MRDVIYLVIAGCLIGLGTKAVDWLIPAPEKRIVVCMNSDTGKGICSSLADVQAAHKLGKPAF